MGKETGTSYATERDLYLYGLPPGALAPSPRPAEGVDTSTNRIVVRSHGLVADEAVALRGTIPGGLSASSVYYARVVSQDILELAATPGGAAIDITSFGPGVLYVIPQSTPEQVAGVLEQVSRRVDGALRAHRGPLVTWSTRITSIVARIAAHRLAAARGDRNPEYRQALEALRYEAEVAQRELAALAAGEPLDVLTEDQTPSVADHRAIGFAETDQRGPL